MMGSQLGVLQGGKHWRELGAVYAAVGIGRICFGGVGVLLKPDLTGAMAGVAVGAAAPVLIGMFLLRGSSKSSRAETKRIVHETLHGTHALLAFFAIANTDILLARNLLDADVSGIYAAGVIIAKAGLFLPQFVIVVVFPSLATAPGDTRRLTRAIGAVAGLALCAVLGTALLPDLVVTVVGGEEYAAIGPVAWLFAITGSAYAVLQMVVYAAIAQQERRAAPAMWIGLGVLCLTALILLGFDVATGVAGVRVLASTAATVALGLTVVLALGLHRETEGRG
jgi:O-antigen/teichoic acid export membrane protein